MLILIESEGTCAARTVCVWKGRLNETVVERRRKSGRAGGPVDGHAVWQRGGRSGTTETRDAADEHGSPRGAAGARARRQRCGRRRGDRAGGEHGERRRVHGDDRRARQLLVRGAAAWKV